MGGCSVSMRAKSKPAAPMTSATNGSGMVMDTPSASPPASMILFVRLSLTGPSPPVPSSPLQLSARSYACIMYRRDHGGSTSDEPDRARRMSRYRRYVGEVLPTTGDSEYGWSCVALRAWHPHKVPRAPAGPDHRLAEGITA